MPLKMETIQKNKPPMPRTLSGKLLSLVTGIPQKHLVFVGNLLGVLVYAIDYRHRRIVARNLKFTHSDWSATRIRKLSIRVFQNFGITVLEILQLPHLSGEDILRKVRIRGKQNLINALKGPKGIIMISAHLGNWEMSTLFTSNYFRKPVVAVARQIKPKALDRWVYRLRTRFGNTILDKKGALPAMARTLHKGNILGILIDQGPKRSEGVDVEFLGRVTTATPAAAMLARRFDSTVLPAFCVREPDGGLTLVVEPPLALKKTKDSRADLQINTQIMADAIGKAVSTYPEQWFWFHKRWKRHHPHLYKEDLARRKSKKRKMGMNFFL